MEAGAINDKRKSDARAANRITWVGVVVNLLLASFKLVAGVVGNSAVRHLRPLWHLARGTWHLRHCPPLDVDSDVPTHHPITRHPATPPPRP